MINNTNYQVELRINGTLLGDIRHLAQGLNWVRRRTKVGVDEINFSVNDVLLEDWLNQRNTDIRNILKPLALDCRIIRNGVPVMGGFLATMPNYTANGTSGTLALRFDGYLNYLGGVYINPTPLQTKPLQTMISDYIKMADTRATNAGKAFGFTEGSLDTLASVQQTFDNYTSVKEFIANRSDNVTGAGPFDVFFHPDRKYDIIAEANLGSDRTNDYTIFYPTQLNSVSATSISAPEIESFASTVIGLGAGEVSSDPTENTVITNTQTNAAAVAMYGYAETIYQNSSVSRQDTLNTQVSGELAAVSNPLWRPEITLIGRQVAPSPIGSRCIWLGDKVYLSNSADHTGTMDGLFRVNELNVSVSEANGETITPTLERLANG